MGDGDDEAPGFDSQDLPNHPSTAIPPPPVPTAPKSEGVVVFEISADEVVQRLSTMVPPDVTAAMNGLGDVRTPVRLSPQVIFLFVH
jgi:hypothetical protein